MEELKSVLKELEEDTSIKMNGAGVQLNQINRNYYKQLIIDAILKDAETELNNGVARVKEGVGISILNEKIGYIPLVIDIRFKNLDFDIQEAADCFETQQSEKEQKRLKQKEINRLNRERDNKIRAKKEQIKSEQPKKKVMVLRGIKRS